jgi:hypothetical protein
MKHLILLFLLSIPFSSLHALEFTDKQSASKALYKNNSNIDIENRIFFGFPLGTTENEIIKKIGNPSALLEIKNKRYLFYGDNVSFTFQFGKLSGVVAGHFLFPYQFEDRQSNSDYPPKWTIGELKYGTRKQMVEKILDIGTLHIEHMQFNETQVKDIKIKIRYYLSDTQNIVGGEFLNSIKIDKVQSAKQQDSPKGISIPGVTVKGAIITKQQGKSFYYKKKCEHCGYVNPKQIGSELLPVFKMNFEFKCPKCGKTTKGSIERGQK